MATTIHIRQPKKDDHDLPLFFPASGSARTDDGSVPDLSGVLNDHKGKQVAEGVNETPPPQWSMTFDVKDLGDGPPYKLVISDTSTGDSKTVSGLTLKGLPRATGRDTPKEGDVTRMGDITIDFPTSAPGTIPCTNFCACGTVSTVTRPKKAGDSPPVTCPVSGMMMDGAGNAISGVPLPAPPPQWLLQFNGLLDGVVYTLVVYTTSNSKTISGLTALCTPPDPLTTVPSSGGR